MIKVRAEWLLQIRDLLYELAHTRSSLGERAECLGSSFPGYLESSESMKPDASKHNPDPRYLRGLIEQSGISQRKTAHLLGMSWTGFRNYLRDESDPLYRVAPYPVQFALECLASSDGYAASHAGAATPPLVGDSSIALSSRSNPAEHAGLHSGGVICYGQPCSNISGANVPAASASSISDSRSKHACTCARTALATPMICSAVRSTKPVGVFHRTLYSGSSTAASAAPAISP